MGSLSGAVSIGAHGAGGGGTPPTTTAILLLVAVSAAVGAVVGALRVTQCQRSCLVAAIAAGQAIGHVTLATADHAAVAHQHAHTLVPSMPMIAAHAAAIALTALLVRLAERAYLTACALFLRIVLIIAAPPSPDAQAWTAKPTHRATLRPWLLTCSAGGTRAPPSLV